MADADSTVKPKGQVLVEEFIELKDTDPTKAEAKRKQLRDEFDEEDINIIVNKTPGKTVKEKKAIKASIRSNDPIDLPALPPPAHMPDDTQPRAPVKGEGGLKSTDPTPAIEPLTVEKLEEMMTEYGPTDKMSEKHRKTLSLFGINIDGKKKKSAIETLMEISHQVFGDITELKADMDTKSFTNQKLQNLAPLKSRLKKAGFDNNKEINLLLEASDQKGGRFFDLGIKLGKMFRSASTTTHL